MINKNLKVTKSIVINSSPEKIWDALTNPDKIKRYLFGTETITDWEVGSPIIFQGEYQGHKYKDKGIVLENKLNEIISYDYWSGFSGLEDKRENYSTIIYKIEKDDNNKTTFSWTQIGFANEEGQAHSENNLLGMLEAIKKLVEEEP